MINNEYAAWQYAKSHQKELIKAADNERLAVQALNYLRGRNRNRNAQPRQK